MDEARGYGRMSIELSQLSQTLCVYVGIRVVLLGQQMASSLGDNTHWILVFVATAYRGH